jgi:hypothetical protein
MSPPTLNGASFLASKQQNPLPTPQPLTRIGYVAICNQKSADTTMATSLWASDFKRCLSAKASKASQQQLRTPWQTKLFNKSMVCMENNFKPLSSRMIGATTLTPSFRLAPMQ